VLNGEKTWISNGGIADFYVVFARTGEQPGARGISAFIVDADAPGLTIAERINVIARIRWRGCVHRLPHPGRPAAGRGRAGLQGGDGHAGRVPHLGGGGGAGLRAARAGRGLQRATTRQMFGQVLADFQLTQAKLAEMATGIDTSALLTYRAAWQRDQGRKVTKEAAMAKLHATETAQQVIDAAQMFGGLGVVSGQPWKACTAKSARCASTKARPKCSN
jgi:acyl-CoA dehydrogenase